MSDFFTRQQIDSMDADQVEDLSRLLARRQAKLAPQQEWHQKTDAEFRRDSEALFKQNPTPAAVRNAGAGDE